MSMKNIVEKIQRKLKAWDKPTRARMAYLKYYRTLPLEEKTVLIDSQHGSEIRGNLYYLLRELRQNPQYADYTVYVTTTAGKRRNFESLFQANDIDNVCLVTMYTKEYYKVVASAKYLFNDTSFLPFFIKKEGQVYLNTWHGTPLKTLGRQVKGEASSIGNVQRNLLFADYLLYPNEFTMKHIVEDFMLENIGKATLLMGGYPRNTAFFDKDRAAVIRAEKQLDGKKVYAYMPTWRGVVGGTDPRATTYMQYFLFELDKQLKDDEVLYVNIHPLARKNVVFRYFQHIRTFPQEYETYEFLNAADVLITDYSSVFFDFAITGRKIALFTYDEKEYLADRGMYMSMDELPFPRVSTVDDLLKELRSPKQYDDKAFLEKFCPYDSPDAARLLCERVILGKVGGMEERELPRNGKDNVLIYVGNLAKNGITASLKNLLSNIDTASRNYYLTFDARIVARNRQFVDTLPKGIKFIACMGDMNLSPFRRFVYTQYANQRLPFWFFWKTVKSAYPYELRRRYGDIPFSAIIQFNGYEFDKILMYSQAPANTVIYIHSDMDNEIKTRKSQRRAVLKYAYRRYNKLAVVSEDIMEPTKAFTGGRDDHFYLAKNIINHRDIREKANLSFKLDKDTLVTPLEKTQLQAVLENEGRKFITIGRFSPEKGHLRLIGAFARVWEEHPDTYLVILGGHGVLYEETVAKAAALPCRDHIIIIQSMSNPYIALSRCDYFVLSSFYEGFGIVIAEADILGKPAISTDINGPRGFMKQYGGVLVEDSEEGLYQGMLSELRGEVPVMGVDYEAYNRQAVEQFYRLLQ